MSNVNFPVLNKAYDVSEEFIKQENRYFIAEKIKEYNSDKKKGKIEWKRHRRKTRMAFNQIIMPFKDMEDEDYWEFPLPIGYSKDFVLPFSLSFVGPQTIRLRLTTRPEKNIKEKDSLMITGDLEEDNTWIKTEEKKDSVTYKSDYGSITIRNNPFNIEIRDNKGNLLTETVNNGDNYTLNNSNPMPFSFVRKSEDMKRHIAASFSLQPDEKIYGCGESFTRLNKRGQKLNLWTSDAHGAQTPEMYKPVPFFMSNKGYGMFIHT